MGGETVEVMVSSSQISTLSPGYPASFVLGQEPVQAWHDRIYGDDAAVEDAMLYWYSAVSMGREAHYP